MGNIHSSKKHKKGSFKCYLIKEIKSNKIVYQIKGKVIKKKNNDISFDANMLNSHTAIMKNFTLFSKNIASDIKFILSKDTLIRCTNIKDYLDTGLLVTVNILNKKIVTPSDLLESYCPMVYCPLVIHFCNGNFNDDNVCQCKYYILMAIDGKKNVIDYRMEDERI